MTQAEVRKLSLSLSSDFLQQRHRLSAVLSSPTLFSLTLHRLRLLSLTAKTILIAKHVLSSLRRLTHSHSAATQLRPRDLDAVLLLLLLCDTRHHNPDCLLQAPPSLWRNILMELYVTSYPLGVGPTNILLPYIEAAARCVSFVRPMIMGSDAKAPAAVAAVVALPSVEAGPARACVICREEMGEGRHVCKLPCGHLFHWKCVIPWLRKTNTCPSCRFQLPTDDVIGEIRRLWDVLVRMGGTAKGSIDR